jgi:hypothetical protein
MLVLTSSPLLLECSIASDWYAFFIHFSSITMNTLLGPKISTIDVEFNHQISQTLNPNFIIYFFKDYNKALSTHLVSVPLLGSK